MAHWFYMAWGTGYHIMLTTMTTTINVRAIYPFLHLPLVCVWIAWMADLVCGG